MRISRWSKFGIVLDAVLRRKGKSGQVLPRTGAFRRVLPVAMVAIVGLSAFFPVGSASAADIQVPLTVSDIVGVEGAPIESRPVNGIVAVSGPLPLGIPFIWSKSIDWGDGTQTVGDAFSECDLITSVCTLKVGSGHVYQTEGTYTVTVLAEASNATGTYSASGTGTATVRAATEGPNDLGISIGASPNPVKTKSNLTYKITVANHVGDGATGVVVTNNLPPGVQFVSYSASQGTCLTPAVGATGSMTCDLGNIRRQATADITVVVKVVAPGSSTLTDTATVSATDTDPNASNNSATVATKVFGRK